MLSSGCFDIKEEQPPVQLTPLVEVSVEAMTFSTLLAGENERRSLTITNIGDHALVLENLVRTGSDCFTVDDTDTSKTIEPGDSTGVWVEFNPSTDGGFEGELYILSNDAEGAEPMVALSGGGQAPVIELSPADFEFETQEVGCEQEQEIVIRNTGSLTLLVDPLTFEGSSDELNYNGAYSGWIHLEPGETESFIVTYAPQDEDPDTATITVTSTDPLTPEAVATFGGTAQYAQPVTDEFVWDTIFEIDILFVVDRSESMDSLQESLATNLSGFLPYLDAWGHDYHIAVVSADDPAFRGDIPVMTPTTPNVAGVFAQAADVGAHADAGANTGLQTGLEALSSPLADPGGPNAGFLREDAVLRVLFIGNNDDESAGLVADLVGEYLALKVSPDWTTLSAIVDPASATRYLDAVLTSNGLTADINDEDWASGFLGMVPVTPIDDMALVLSHIPAVETIELEVNGVPVISGGWYYDDYVNAVYIVPGFAPEQEDEVTVSYRMLGACH